MSTLTAISNISTPGMFSIPVCFSDYDWNTPLELIPKNRKWYRLPCIRGDDYCNEKVLPCFCGPWGSQTQAVWSSIGHIRRSPDSGHHDLKICARQIKAKIQDPLEAYVALCRLNIRRSMGDRVSGWYVDTSRKDQYCDDVLGIIERKGYKSVTDVEDDVKYAINCKIISDGATCRMYNSLWAELVNGHIKE
jgi:hypothetical protein